MASASKAKNGHAVTPCNLTSELASAFPFNSASASASTSGQECLSVAGSFTLNNNHIHNNHNDGYVSSGSGDYNDPSTASAEMKSSKSAEDFNSPTRSLLDSDEKNKLVVPPIRVFSLHDPLPPMERKHIHELLVDDSAASFSSTSSSASSTSGLLGATGGTFDGHTIPTDTEGKPEAFHTPRRRVSITKKDGFKQAATAKMNRRSSLNDIEDDMCLRLCVTL
jgi:hypothetical protein